MRTTYGFLIFGLVLLTLALALLVPLILSGNEPKSESVTFVKGDTMPQRMKLYPQALHGCGGLDLPADREIRQRPPTPKGVRA